MKKHALISKCGRYRYLLSRWWDESKQNVCFCMLNPSVADAEVDDPTIRRCVGFAKDWGYGGIFVTNLFAYRATKPRELLTADDPIGPENDNWHYRTMPHMPVVVAWGGHGNLLGRYLAVLANFRQWGIKPLCLGLTRSGQPRHPLYVKKDTERIAYEWTSGQ